MMEEEGKTSESNNLFEMSKIEFKAKKVLTINSNQHQEELSIDSILSQVGSSIRFGNVRNVRDPTSEDRVRR